jgi:hypothetical protein
MSTDTNATAATLSPADLAAQAYINSLSQDKGAALAEQVDAAFRESEKRGFERVLPAMTALNVPWDVVAAWEPATLRAETISAGEQAIRAIHNLARPKSSPATRENASKALQAVRESFGAAAFDEAIKTRRPVANKLPKHSGGGNADGAPFKTIQDARAELSRITGGAWDAAVAAADGGNFGPLYDHVEAACRTLEAALNDAAKFRRLVFLPLIEPTIQASLEANGSGDKIEGVYDGCCAVAYGALDAKKGALGAARKDGPITGDRARELVCEAVAEHLGAKFNPTELTKEEKIQRAIDAIERKLAQLKRLDAIDGDKLVRIRDAMQANGIVFAKVDNGDAASKSAQEQAIADNAAPEPAPAPAPAPAAPTPDSVAAANVAANVAPAPAPAAPVASSNVVDKVRRRNRK